MPWPRYCRVESVNSEHGLAKKVRLRCCFLAINRRDTFHLEHALSVCAEANDEPGIRAFACWLTLSYGFRREAAKLLSLAG